MLLAIDTSTAWAGIALFGDKGAEASCVWKAERMHTVQLMPWVDRLLAARSLTPQALTGVAVATGPGSFTGLRTGIAAAKGISVGLNVPLIGVPTLLYTAWPYRGKGLPIRAVLAVGRNRRAVAAYTPDHSGGLRLEWLRNTAPEGVAEPGDLLYCGEISGKLRCLLADCVGARLPDSGTVPRDPSALASIAWERLLRGATDNAAGLQAAYLETEKKQ